MDRRTFLEDVARPRRSPPWPTPRGSPGRPSGGADRLTCGGRRLHPDPPRHGDPGPDFLALVELPPWRRLRLGTASWCWPIREGLSAPRAATRNAITDPGPPTSFTRPGFPLMGNANNHSMDFGDRGLVSTLENLDRWASPMRHRGGPSPSGRGGFYDSRGAGLGRQLRLDLPSSFPAGPAHPYVLGAPASTRSTPTTASS